MAEHRIAEPRALLSEDAWLAMAKAAGQAHPSETGGVLIGVLTRTGGVERPWVTDALEISSLRRGHAYYELPPGSRENAVSRIRRRDPRVGYLGDWHSHPADVGPSGTDATSIASIAVTGDCAAPLLFVVRRSCGEYQLDGWQWAGGALRRLSILHAGILPPTRGRFTARRVARWWSQWRGLPALTLAL